MPRALSQQDSLASKAISGAQVSICRRPDGSEWLLGQGSYGKVGPACPTIAASACWLGHSQRTSSSSSPSAPAMTPALLCPLVLVACRLNRPAMNTRRWLHACAAALQDAGGVQVYKGQRLGAMVTDVAIKRLQFTDAYQTQQFIREVHLHKVSRLPCLSWLCTPAQSAQSTLRSHHST